MQCKTFFLIFCSIEMSEREKKIRIFLRKWHRDIGFFISGLTIIYAISGVAVNHIDDWNPSYTITKEMLKADSIPQALWNDPAIDSIVTARLKVEKPKEVFWESDEKVRFFYEGETIDFNLATGEMVIETTKGKPVLKEVNFLHLNKPKKVWTWVADIFAVLLAFLAISGVIMVKGKNGFGGKGKWIFIAGLLIPVIFWFLYLD